MVLYRGEGSRRGFAILRAKSKEEAIQLAKDFLQVVGEGECELRQILKRTRACRRPRRLSCGRRGMFQP